MTKSDGKVHRASSPCSDLSYAGVSYPNSLQGYPQSNHLYDLFKRLDARVTCQNYLSGTSDSSGNYNHYWLWTDLDTGGQGWVSAYYLSLWGNDQAKDNSGNVIPDC